MPSEKKSKKHKAAQKESANKAPLKPLESYVGDRLELTKQLFSCIKSKEIKQRLPENLRNKSIEKVQQLCLDEILGISTKRLKSIINNTECPENTDSDDSEVEHISLDEISSDSGNESKKKKDPAKKQEPVATKAVENKDANKTPKEMTMLELLELQARARAIRSQLALEPVTKIELDSDDEADKTTTVEKSSTSRPSSSSSNSKPEKLKVANKITESSWKSVTAGGSQDKKKIEEPNQSSITSVPPLIPDEPKSKPVKLKRNYKTKSSENSEPTTLTKEPSPPKANKNEENSLTAKEDERCSSPEVITMEASPETFFISDSEDEQQANNKSPEKETQIEESIEKFHEESSAQIDDKEQEEGELPAEDENESQDYSPKSSDKKDCSESKETSPDKDRVSNSADDEDVVHLMSDTEIELHHHSEKEDEDLEVPEKKAKLTLVELENESMEKDEDLAEKTADVSNSVHSDDDVIEINHSTDDDMMNESEKSAGETSKNQETWEERWLSSAKTQTILKTTQLASKVRGNILKTKKSQKAREKNKIESEKALKEKLSNLEEGSMQQFKVIKENSN
ncbi:CLUMA_CG015082, isoform A [Clunio marinus]|uniref:CLUMA_CG015082, isoform A n=1 Tax=Clunio marinus TaxID=568069 RepID=A0A1J1INU1_9DIPT|nr:CLUMA_CG015082, isoform A [Clunio marinus]